MKMNSRAVVNKKHLLAVLLASVWMLLSATMIVNENIQSWTAHASYGSYTQDIPAGTVNMTRCLVSPGAAANGVGSPGRIQCEASTGVLEFPEFSSSGEVEFVFAAGSSGRSIRLQRFTAGSWTDLYTFNGITATGSRFFYQVSQPVPTKLRLASPSHAVYIYDIFATDFQGSAIPILSLPVAGEISYSTAQVSAIVESSGSAPITTRGFCWSTTAQPDTLGQHISTGRWISPMSTTIIGLLPDTDYHIRAYALNANGLAFSPELTIHTSSIDAPTIQTSQLAFYPGNSTIQLSWTPGNGSRRLIRINTTNSFTLPADGIEYPPDTVYSGTGEQSIYCAATQIIDGEEVNAVTVTGLQQNTQYWFRAFEVNGSGASAHYHTDTAAGNPGFTITLNTGLAGYYDEISGYGLALKSNLHQLLQTTHYTQFSYASVWQQLQYTDEDSTNTNNVLETYTGWSVPKNYYGGDVTNWNREHTWSTSHGGFDTNRPAGTDLHHIRPCDVTVNSAKGNKDFDNGGNPYVDASPYGGYNGNTGCYADTDSWEPRLEEKGDVARMLFYMALRYEGTDTTYDLEMQDSTPTTGPYYGKLSTLLQWHYEDPPDGWERRRNNRIQERQGNRNPFIDHPEYVSYLWTPHALNAVVQDPDNFTARWEHSLNAVSYSIDVSNDAQFSSFLYENYDVGINTEYNFNIPEHGFFVFYRVRAFLGNGYSPYSQVITVTLVGDVMVELSNFTATVTAQHQVQIQWVTESETDLAGFYLWRSNSSYFENAVLLSPLINATNTSQTQNYMFLDTEINASGSYYYWLEALAMVGINEFFGPCFVYVDVTDNEDDVQISQPPGCSVYPNPFSAVTTCEIELKSPAPLKLEIYNLKGQRLITLLDQHRPAGQFQLVWDGKDGHGRQSANGVYLLRLSSGNYGSTRKLILMK